MVSIFYTITSINPSQQFKSSMQRLVVFPLVIDTVVPEYQEHKHNSKR